MRISRNFRPARACILAVLLSPFTSVGYAQDSVMLVEVERIIDLAVTIEPPVLTLSEERELRTWDVTVTLNVVVLPELIGKAAACRGLTCIMQTQVADVIDGKPAIPEAEAAAYFAAETQSSIDLTRRFYPDGDIVVVESVDNSPDAAARLEAMGYNSSGLTRRAVFGGNEYSLTQWEKGVPKRDESSYGKASARIDIRTDADVDFENSVFAGRFESTAPIAFELVDLPDDPVRRQKAIELFAEYRALVTERYMAAIDTLNEKRRLLNQDDIALLQGDWAGETHYFHKKITLDWFMEKKTVDVVIAASAHGPAAVGGLEDWSLNYFEDDEGWLDPPDSEDPWEVVP